MYRWRSIRNSGHRNVDALPSSLCLTLISHISCSASSTRDMITDIITSHRYIYITFKFTASNAYAIFKLKPTSRVASGPPNSYEKNCSRFSIIMVLNRPELSHLRVYSRARARTRTHTHTNERNSSICG